MSLAITVADVMVKTAQIRLIGVERTIGSGMMLVKIAGDVAAVRTALSAGEETARAHQGFVACTTIARPAKEISVLASTTKPPRDELVQKTTALPAITLTASAAHTTTGPESVQEDPDAEKAVPPVKQAAEGSTDNIIQVDAINEPVEMAGKSVNRTLQQSLLLMNMVKNNLWRRSKHFRPREISLLTTIFRQRQREPLPLCSMSNPEYLCISFILR
jgi:microcompartment protein CcmL/EutN